MGTVHHLRANDDEPGGAGRDPFWARDGIARPPPAVPAQAGGGPRSGHQLPGPDGYDQGFDHGFLLAMNCCVPLGIFGGLGFGVVIGWLSS